MPTPPVLNVGFYNYVLTDKIVALVSSESAPMRRLVQSVRKSGSLIDATQGRRTKCVIFTTGDAVILSAISQETLAKRLSAETMGADPTGEEAELEDAE
ncbi:MAG TPA: DUF370 domain-containing protein [Fimbriimonadaceae bacterium]|nr:DUF370 domain-containing protein [Fimbriimonadaceae bacterium]